jgi:hypothetical protein
MENIWGPQRKTGNMEEESLREENRKAHEEDERFRMTAVKAAGQVRQRMRCATGESDEVIRRKFMLPERYILTLMTVETLGQERMLLDLMAGSVRTSCFAVVVRSMPICCFAPLATVVWRCVPILFTNTRPRS